MIINQNQEILANNYAGKTNAKQKPTGSEFGAILNETLGQTSQATANDPQMPKIEGLSKTQFDFFSSAENGTVKQVENFLKILSDYQEKLGNPEAGLKEISPLVDQMRKEKQGLASALNALPDGDGLKEILNETLILSSLETIKFNRGDYNPQ